MIDIRMLQGEEMKEAVRLSDSIFRDTEQFSMGVAFPHIFADPFMHLSFGAFEDGKMIAFMGLVPWTIHIGDAALRVFSLGSVCTHPDARGKGVASLILEKVYAFIKEAGASLLLVSGTRSLYTRAGCKVFGRVRKYSLQSGRLVVAGGVAEGGVAEGGGLVNSGAANGSARLSSSKFVVRDMAPSDVFTLAELANERAVRYEFSVNELAALMKSEAWASCLKMKHRVLIAERVSSGADYSEGEGDSRGEGGSVVVGGNEGEGGIGSGSIAAFAVIGVPGYSGNSGLVIEHAGDADAVAHLFGYAAERLGMNGLNAYVPWQEQELCSELDRFGAPYAEENNLGTVRIANIDALLAQLQPWLASRNPALADKLSIREEGDGAWMASIGSDSIQLTTQQLIALLFDCANPQGGDLPDDGPSIADIEIPDAFKELFPIPFPYAGGLAFI